MEEDRERPRTARSRWSRLLGGVLLVLLLALAALWLARKPLATRYADRFLASKGVPARYRIVDLGFGRQRLTNVVLGDPKDPDLVADWLEARTAMGLGGPYLTGVRGGHVRLRARLVDGRLSLGSIDRLLPVGPSHKPLTLPALDLDVADLRARVSTPWGLLGAKLSGRGRLDGGFDGRLAVVARSLGQAGCAVGRITSALRVHVDTPDILGSSARFVGPLQTGSARCAGAALARLQSTVDANLVWGQPRSFGAARGSSVRARLVTGALTHRFARTDGLHGDVSLVHEGGLDFGIGTALTAANVRAFGVRAGMLRLDGGISRQGGVLLQYTGRIGLTDVDARALLPHLPSATGTPVAPLLDQLDRASRMAAGRFSGEADLSAFWTKDLHLLVRRVALSSASGARADLRDEALDWRSTGKLSLGSSVRLSGGGFPTLIGHVAKPGYSAPLRADITIAPFSAGAARLAFRPVTLTQDAAGWRLTTQASLSGPLGDGRVEGLTLPIDARWDGRRFVLGPGCAPVGWQRLAVSGLVLDRGGLRLCPTGGALVTVAGGRVEGGVSIAGTRLTGRLGSTPLTLAATRASVRLSDRGFTLGGVEARLGRAGRLTRLDIASLEGRTTAAGLGGRFAGAGGRIGAVPLLLSDASGEWRFANGALTIGGALTVGDAQVERPRFKPLPIRAVTLSLRGNHVEAAGSVRSPDAAREVAAVTLTHDLRAGAGAARFTIPGLVFDKALQPEALTPITFGVIADVRGTVAGEGRIDWGDAGVTSTGTFRTDGIDLAAAFGPVQGIAGAIHFTDLLALKSAPGQQVTVREVNPGIPVTDGVVRFRTLPDARVQVQGGRWPFAGGTLTLEPTLLDFGAAAQRRMTFRVDGMAADQFLQQFDFKNLNATGTFDGVLPMIFDQSGGRIEGGRMVVRPGGGQIAYVGPIGQKDIGFWPNLAFQALKSLRYRSLTVGMDGPLAGEMVTEVRFAGISQGEGAARGGIAGLFVRRLQRLPFIFNIRIRAPFRGLLDATASFYDPKRLVQRALPQLLEEQDKRDKPPAIQPPASRKVP